MAYSETDFRVSTPGLPIVFTRTWNSQGGLDEDLGDGWMHSYGWYVDDYGTYGKKVIQGDGRTHYYNCEDSNDSYSACDGDGSEVAVYVAHPGPAEYLTLTEDEDDYILTFDHGQVVYYFDKDKDNRLRLMDHPKGNNILITFDGADSDIDTIASRHDTTTYASVDVTCDANHVITSIDDAESNTYTYTYSSGMLETRVYPSSLSTRTFYYGDQTDIGSSTLDMEDGGDADNLTWVEDEEGEVAFLVSYDGSDRCDTTSTMTSATCGRSPPWTPAPTSSPTTSQDRSLSAPIQVWTPSRTPTTTPAASPRSTTPIPSPTSPTPTTPATGSPAATARAG